MNKIMFDIAINMNDGIPWDIRTYAKILYKPFSIIEQEYKNMEHAGYVAGDRLTLKAKKYLEVHKIDTAIILAAGISSRFVPICFETPKALLKVKGEVLIERQIKQLIEKGIKKIVIVVGYMKERFYYLRNKYGVVLVETDTYNLRNNHASVYAARKYLGNTIVTSADLYFNTNIFQTYAYDAYYTCVYKEGQTEERGIETDIYDKINKTFYSANDTWVTLGYAYFNKRFSENFLNIMEEEYNYPETMGKFWADIQDEHLSQLYMYAKRCDNNIIYEFDSLEELRGFDTDYINDTKSEIISKMAIELGTNQGKLKQFKPISKEDLSRGFTFIYEHHKYLCKVANDHSIVSIKRYDDSLQELLNLIESFSSYYNMTLPLCAAENVISPFVKLPLSMGFQERYIVGNTYSYMEKDNFIGSTYLLPFYQMISEKCEKIFHAKYTDARTLTGMNCLMMVLTALSNIGDKIVILGADAGGHSSVKPIAERLGLVVSEAPFDYKKQDIDYDRLNVYLKEENVKFVLIAPSDIIRPFEIQKMNTEQTILLYDASQILGLIGAGIITNPLDEIKNMVLFGGTHKTFPGPASGIIMTNDEKIHTKLETTINPIYIRHTQMHQKVSLLFALIEFDIFGKTYEEHIIELSNSLAQALHKYGFNIGTAGNVYTETHEIFMYTSEEVMNRIYENGIRFGITFNKKHKKLFNGYGIRFGTQEIARYGWPKETMSQIAEIIYEISKLEVDDAKVHDLIASLPEKKIQYTFDESEIVRFKKYIM